MLQMLALLIIPILSPELPRECDVVPRPKEFLEFEAKSTWAERMERGEFSVVEKIAIAPKPLSEIKFHFHGFVDEPRTFVSGDPVYFLGQEDPVDLIEWAREQGWAGFDWRQMAFKAAVSSAKSCEYEWLRRQESSSCEPTKTNALAAFPEEMRATRQANHPYINIDKQFNANRIYSETWAARWFPVKVIAEFRGGQPDLQPGSFHYNDLDPMLIHPRRDAFGGAIVIAKEQN